MIKPSFKGVRGAGWAAALAALLSVGLLAGCGGGGGGGSAEQPAALTVGPVSGFGSIIVNGVRFDDSSASVEGDDDGSHGRDDIQLGMMVEIESDAIDDSTGRANALHVSFGSEIVGPVTSVDPGTSTFVVFGRTIEVNAETVFEDSLPGGFAALLPGFVVEIHALFDAASGHFVATRIEKKNNPSQFKLSGVVSLLDPIAKTFQIGTQVINYASATEVPAALADGLKVRVRVDKTQVAGQWVAIKVKSRMHRGEDFGETRLRGTVSSLTDATHFLVDGVAVDATAAEIDDGPVVNGDQVEVRGHVEAGILMASRVKVRDEDDEEDRDFELHGVLSGLDPVAKTFVLRGVNVSFAAMPLAGFENGATADNIAGQTIEVEGVLATDGSTLLAQTIKLDDD